MKINWLTISRAIEYYQNMGFKYIETPWIVTSEVAKITCPDSGNLDIVQGQGVLVASAEQGFLQLDMDGLLDNVNYVSCGPCFRSSNGGLSAIHKSYFMKVELYTRCKNQDQAWFAAKELTNRAGYFMGKSTKSLIKDHGWDLEINNIEVGSYGARYHPDIGWWAFGTGLAEPRYTQALKQI